jgi:putative drug exporter of the RND superfamily
MPQLTTPTLSHAGVAEPPGPRPPVGPLGRLAGVSFRHRWRVVLAWVAALALAIGLAAAANGEFSADYSAPGSDSEQAQTLLEEQFPSQSGDTIDVVVRSAAPVTDPAVQQDVSALLDELTSLPHVVGVDDPDTTPGGIAPDGQTLVVRGWRSAACWWVS